MMIAVVIDTNRRRHEFATWAQAEAFADAVGMSVALMPEVIDVVRLLAGVTTKCGVIVRGGAERPTLKWVQHEHRFTTPHVPVVNVGADWLDHELIPLVDSVLIPLLDSVLIKEV